ncbi:centriolar and ciliogenesis-associated protein HYSL1-like [Ostrea edulis]|uniref:centriolar and ciliogenesis-associated protein HYSL1-like n=1 Tax=Ostrea edulis TaxID=37623 RepID=UPI0020941D39|nr:centriolar and ciliogenesis-associated protein HYSL1-like [Ostrea edulis]XP_048737190.1 centriolar and ciliogenesis-associated protein HYSL1-like [Ostrea edulis]XP_056020502.1 centriolar and ciliogenesis-associated protein HYSL1-like [Ostrea edulis]
MDDDLDFTDDEIRDELSKLGYRSIPRERLQEFKKDLRVLIQHERSKLSNDTSLSSRMQTDASDSFLDPSHRQQEDSPPSHSYFSMEKENRPQRYDYGDPIIRKPLQPSQLRGEFALYDSRLDSTKDDFSGSESGSRMMKRKVLRKKTDGSKVIDESFTESESGSVLDINERLRLLGIDTDRPRTAPAAEPPYRLSPDDPRPASVILRPSEHPHMRNVRKSDPVARYQQFRQSWCQQRAPGEKKHNQLRWNIREQMLAQDQVIEKKPQRVYVPNKYVVPTDKQRKSLRWQIRMDLAQGQMPAHGFFHEY